jgi:hypothetical protein
MSDNITITEDLQNTPPVPQSSQLDAEKTTNQVSLLNVEIVDENIALNVMVSFLDVAQRRGAFNMAESAKVWECVQKFIQRQQSA